MSNQRHPTESGPHPDYLHEKNVPLLDAYSTHELEEGEQEEVELHLTACRECQRLLATIRHFRGLFTILATDDHRPDIDGETILVQRDHPSSELADNVLNEIAKNGGETMKQEPLPEILQEHPLTNRFLRRRSRSSWLSLVAILCAVLLTGSLLVTFTYLHQSSIGPTSIPPSLAWERYQGQFLAHNAEGIFSIKYIDITSQEFRFFYAVSSSNHRPPRVSVVSYLASNPGTSTRLVTTVQSLGQLGAFNVGVVHAHVLNRVGQIIALQITPSVESASTPTWRLAPLKQLLNNAFANWGFPIEQAELPEVFWYGPVMKEQVGFFKSTGANQPGSRTLHIFLRLDDPVAVKIITQAEYLSIAGQQNFF
jgi:hypothetical protein